MEKRNNLEHVGQTRISSYCLGIRQRPEPVVVLLTGSIPKSQVDGLAIYHHVGGVVVEHSGNVLAGKGVRRVADEQTRLT